MKSSIILFGSKAINFFMAVFCLTSLFAAGFPTAGHDAITTTPEKREMLEIVYNAIARNRGSRCKPLKDDVVCEKIDWFTKKEIRDDETWDKVLTRLVSYQVIEQSLPEESDDAAFATVLDTIRGVNQIIAEPGSLIGDNGRVLDALDIILSDICGGTQSSKVDRRLQEMVDLIQAGIRTQPPPYDVAPAPPVCRCISQPLNSTTCIEEAEMSWNSRKQDWVCRCFEARCGSQE